MARLDQDKNYMLLQKLMLKKKMILVYEVIFLGKAVHLGVKQKDIAELIETHI